MKKIFLYYLILMVISIFLFPKTSLFAQSSCNDSLTSISSKIEIGTT
jgi:hypothetical protein